MNLYCFILINFVINYAIKTSFWLSIIAIAKTFAHLHSRQRPEFFQQLNVGVSDSIIKFFLQLILERQYD